MEILKNIKKNTIILIIITALVMYIVLRKDFPVIIKNFKILDLKYILIALICFALYIVLHSYVVYKTVNENEKFTFAESIKHNIITQFFNGITPFSTGGQPMEIYMLTKHKISVSTATTYILQNFIFYQLALVLFGIIAVIINFFLKLFPQIPVLRYLVLLGFILNTLVALALMFICFSKKTTKLFLEFTLNILYKIHMLKDKEKTKNNWLVKINEFHQSAKQLQKRKALFFWGITLNFIGLVCLYSIPLFIVFALHDFKSLNFINTITASAYVMVMGSFIPIPGASGGIEYGFTQFFNNFLTPTKTKTTLLLWRFITYYLGMILGAIAFNLDRENKEKDE